MEKPNNLLVDRSAAFLQHVFDPWKVLCLTTVLIASAVANQSSEAPSTHDPVLDQVIGFVKIYCVMYGCDSKNSVYVQNIADDGSLYYKRDFASDDGDLVFALTYWGDNLDDPEIDQTAVLQYSTEMGDLLTLDIDVENDGLDFHGQVRGSSRITLLVNDNVIFSWIHSNPTVGDLAIKNFSYFMGPF